MRVTRIATMARTLKYRANMKTFCHLGVAAAFVALTLAAPGVRAEEAAGLGISMDGYVAPTLDRTVANQDTGAPSSGRNIVLGVAALANFGPLAVGGVVDGNSGFGPGRLTMGGIAGWQPQSGRSRLQVLGELGAERFSNVAGGLVSVSNPEEIWLPYVGARLGMTQTFGRGDHFEMGWWLFARKDLGESSASIDKGSFLGGEPLITTYTVGGYSGGAALRIGVRFDQKRRASESSVEGG
jgi:hypothetical protein